MWAGLGAVLLGIASGLVFRALATLGFGYVAYKGINTFFDSVKAFAQDQFSVVPVQIMQIFGLAKIDVCINIILAALTARLLIAGLGKVTGTLTTLALINR